MQHKPRNVWVAAILTFLTTGLGHVYAGEIRKGIYFYSGQYIILLLSSILIVTASSSFAVIIAVFLLLGYSFYAIYDSVITAKKGLEDYQLKSYNKVYIYIIIYALSVFMIKPVIAKAVKGNVVQTFQISGGSMQPTIIIGDQVVVNNLIFKYSRPDYEDIVTFRPPHKDTVYVKRVVAFENDLVEIRDKALFVNNMKVEENFVIHSDKRVFPESMNTRDNFGPLKIPEGHVFLLGDNRDNSDDSRFYGSVDLKNVYGKVIFVYWSFDEKNSRIRWKRVLKRL